MNPYLSIIVPVYNVQAYIDQCIQSLIKQTFTDIEIILVDDGSPDNCGHICDEYALKDNRIKVIHQKNAGLSVARNTGLTYATGEYIAFCDSDDFVDEDMYRTLVEYSKMHDADIVKCGYKTFHNNKILSQKNFKKIELLYNNTTKEKLLPLYFTSGLCVIVCNAIYKKSIVQDVKFPVGLINEDQYASGIYLFRANTLVTVNKALYYYRQNMSGLSKNIAPTKKPLDILVCLSMLHEDLLKFGLKDGWFLKELRASISRCIYKIARRKNFVIHMDNTFYSFVIQNLNIRRKIKLMYYKWQGYIVIKQN